MKKILISLLLTSSAMAQEFTPLYSHGIPNYKEEFEKLASFELENINSAWYNSYTCI